VTKSIEARYQSSYGSLLNVSADISQIARVDAADPLSSNTLLNLHNLQCITCISFFTINFMLP